MHALGTAQLLHQGSGVWGDKSQVLFVNDKAIISLVLHTGKKKSYSKDSNKDPWGDNGTHRLEKFFFFFPSQEQTNEPLRATERLRQSYPQTRWQAAPAQVLNNSGRGRQASRGRRDTKTDRPQMREKKKEQRRKEQENQSGVKVKRQKENKGAVTG